MDRPHSSDSAVLESERLVLRDFKDDDAELITEYFGEQQAQAHLLRSQRQRKEWASYVARATQYANLAPFASRRHIYLAVVLRDTRELIGMCTLSDAQRNSVRARLGWHLSSRYAGLGYATEASLEVIRYAFEERKVALVYADCFASNVAAIRVFAKLGMRPSAHLALLKWLLAVKYLERKPIVRYVIENQLRGGSIVT